MSVSKDQLQNEAEIQTDDKGQRPPSDNGPKNATESTTESTTENVLNKGSGLVLVREFIGQKAAPPEKMVAQKNVISWQIVAVKPRVDSSNQTELISEVRGLIAQGHRFVAINLKDNRFLSLPVIKYCVDAAQKLWPIGGDFVLLSCPEKTKRHFEIYGTLEHIRILRSANELCSLANAASSSPEHGNESVI